MSFFPSDCLIIFFFNSLVFRSITVIYLDADFLFIYLLGVLRTSQICGLMCFVSFGEFSAFASSAIYSALFLSFLLSWTQIICRLDHLIVSSILLTLSFVFFILLPSDAYSRYFLQTCLNFLLFSLQLYFVCSYIHLLRSLLQPLYFFSFIIFIWSFSVLVLPLHFIIYNISYIHIYMCLCICVYTYK